MAGISKRNMSYLSALKSYIHEQHVTFKGTAAAVFYGVCSVSMAFINKALMTTYNFDFPVFIMVFQMIFTIFILEVLSILQIIQMPSYTLQRGKSFFLPALFYGINALFGLTALSHMNIAMYGVLKRCVPLVTMFLSVFILRKGFPSKCTMISVMLLTTGCIIAGYGDLHFNIVAYTCGAISNITQSLYLLLVQKYSDKDVTTVETLQLNSFNTLPFLAAYMFISGEIYEVVEYKHKNDVGFILIFCTAVSFGCLLNYSLFLCTSVTSALTTSVVGGLKALMQTLFGLFTFGGVSHNIPTYFGISVNLCGSIIYLVAKYAENLTRKSHGEGMKKVMSFSTAEDFKDMARNGSSNGYLTKHLSNGVLHPISEESDIEDLHERKHKDDDDNIV